MKLKSLLCIVLAAFAVNGALALSASAQDAPAKKASSLDVLTKEERGKLMKASKAAAADPSLAADKAQIDQLAAAAKASGSKEDKTAYMRARRGFDKKVREVVIKQDPSMEEIYKKVDDRRKEIMQQAKKAQGTE